MDPQTVEEDGLGSGGNAPVVELNKGHDAVNGGGTNNLKIAADSGDGTGRLVHVEASGRETAWDETVLLEPPRFQTNEAVGALPNQPGTQSCGVRAFRDERLDGLCIHMGALLGEIRGEPEVESDGADTPVEIEANAAIALGAALGEGQRHAVEVVVRDTVELGFPHRVAQRQDAEASPVQVRQFRVLDRLGRHEDALHASGPEDLAKPGGVDPWFARPEFFD